MAGRIYDAVIAGAGPAGCLLARNLAQEGRSVLLVERGGQSDLGHDWWDTMEAGIFRRVGLEPPAPPERGAPFRFEIESPIGETGCTAIMPECMVNVDRKLLGQRLFEAATDAGAEVQFNTTVKGPEISDGCVSGVCMENATGKSEIVNCRVAADATGEAGVLRRAMPGRFGFSSQLERGDCVLTWREIREDRNPAGRSVLVVGAHAGAQWVSRGHGGLADVFACVMDRPGHPDPKKLAHDLADRVGELGGEVVRGGRGARIPIRRAFDSFTAPGLVLMGDSACMANPLNGSGASSALWAAHLASRTILRAMEQGRCGNAELWPYNAAYKRTQDRKFVKLYALQKFLLREDPAHFHAVFSKGFMSEDSLWVAENRMGLANSLDKLPVMLRMLDRPGFTSRMAFVLLILERLDQHYRRFPVEYKPEAFMKWQRRLHTIFNMIPDAGYDSQE